MSVAYIVDSSGLTYGQPYFDSKWLGPIVYNGFLWIVAEADTATQAFVGVFKSDQAYPGTVTSFTLQDSINAPEITAGKANAFYPKAGGSKISISYSRGAGISLVEFDMSAGTYGTPITGGPTPIQNAHRLARRGNGNWVVIYDLLGGGSTRNVYWAEYSGSWSAGVRISTDAGASDIALAVQMQPNDSDDVLLIWQTAVQSHAYNYDYNYRVLANTANTLSAVRSWLTNQYQDLNQGNSGGALYITAQDEWIFPFSYVKDISDNYVAIAKASPSADPSADSVENVSTSPNAADVPAVRAALDATEATIYCLWSDNNGDHQLLYATQSVPSTSWTPAASPLFDTSVDTFNPTTGVSPQLAQRPSLTISSTGDLLFTLGTFAPKLPSGTSCDVQYFSELIAPPPADLSVSCPVGGGTATVGVPYSAQIVATGGTEPYMYGLSSGSFPPGITLDPDTGIVSGTPTTAGTYNYTPEVTDSSSPPQTAVGAVPCQIAVSGASGTGPCENIIPQPETDNRFKLIKVMATIKDDRHLPVRGSVR